VYKRQEVGALSADHLDYVSEKNIQALAQAQVVAVVLPGATFFTGGKHYAPARRMIDQGVTVAIATDYNPGTNPCLNLFLTGTIAATQMSMTLDEVWPAITINAARALGIDKECGTLAPDKRADLVVLKAPDEYYPFYRYDLDCVRQVIKNGQLMKTGR
jgi:imidazolonepropionase